MADDAPLQFGCPQCLARLSAPAALAGERIRCPRCQWTFKVPRHSVVHSADEGYALQGETGTPPVDEPAYILTVCPVCHTRLFPTEDQIGEETVCPDCGTRVLVGETAPKPKKKPFRTPEEIGEYPLATGPAPAVQPEWITVWCPVCHTRMYAPPEEEGKRLICPDCGTSAVIPPAPPPRAKPNPMDGADGGYRIAAPDDEKEVVLEPSEEPSEEASGEAKPVDERFEKRSRPPLPAHPFREGTFDFPFFPATRGYFVGLAAWFAIVGIFASASIELAGHRGPTEWTGSAMLGAATFVLAMMGLLFAAASGLAIVRDTSEGFDRITSWPGFSFTEWMFDLLYLFNAMCVAVLPGYAVSWLLAQGGISMRWLSALGAFFLFPIALLSMLETGSPFGVASGAVWQTMRVAKNGWRGFYAASGVLVVSAGGLAVTAFLFGGTVGVVSGTTVLVVAWFIYFRLLGRLAWYCTDRTAAAELEEELEEDETEEEDDTRGA